MLRNNIYWLFTGGIALMTLFGACAGGEALSRPLPTDQPTLDLISQGEQLIVVNCYSCHSTDAPLEGGRLAPPMEAVKSHYLNEESTVETFTADLIRFVHKPSPAYSKMPGARKRFGLMPALPLPEEELKAIAAFIYYKDLEAPAWLEKHQQGEQKEQEMLGLQDTYAKKGKTLAMQTKAVLGKNLMAALNDGGAENALRFCNTRAIPLTDSSSLALNASIRRVSDRPRNPNNAADSLQLIQIEEIRAELAQGITESHRLVEGPDQITGYYPIITNGMCLQCHGEKGSQVTPTTLTALQALYPEDKATGYAINQLRGIWVVTMPRE